MSRSASPNNDVQFEPEDAVSVETAPGRKMAHRAAAGKEVERAAKVLDGDHEDNITADMAAMAEDDGYLSKVQTPYGGTTVELEGGLTEGSVYATVDTDDIETAQYVQNVLEEAGYEETMMAEIEGNYKIRLE